MKLLQNADANQVKKALGKNTSMVLGLPFDTARALYAMAVRVGLIENSLLNSARFGRYIHSLEKVTLGPLARQV